MVTVTISLQSLRDGKIGSNVVHNGQGMYIYTNHTLRFENSICHNGSNYIGEIGTSDWFTQVTLLV